MRENIDEMPGQQRYIFGTVTQRRNGDGENVEPVKQVLPKLAFRNHLPQVVVGGGDQSHIRFDCWRKRLRDQEVTVRFALVERGRVRPEPAAAGLELILTTGERLHIGVGVDGATLRMVLEALRG